jgi:putative DNA primase/helicase
LSPSVPSLANRRVFSFVGQPSGSWNPLSAVLNPSAQRYFYLVMELKMNEILSHFGDYGECDRREIGRAVALLFPGDTVVELRALEAGKFWTISGFFDGTHRRELVEFAGYISGHAMGVYITLNPVNPDLLARACNQAKGRVKEATQNSEIVKRTWLPIDFDPKRPSGISSNDKEHEAALERAKECRAFLREQGFPEPIFADSGNGSHLLYSIDLPNHEESTQLIKVVLVALDSRFSDDSVGVDKGVFNAGRIWKLYGTQSRKGDDTADRPHRIARILEAPKQMEIVPRETLEKVAGTSIKILDKVAGVSVKVNEGDKTFNEIAYSGKRGPDAKKWLIDHGITITKEKDNWNGSGGTLYEINPCPFNPEQTNSSAFVIQHANGGISAGCHHTSCLEKKWKDLRDLKEPGWREAELRAIEQKEPGWRETELRAIEGIEDPARLARLCLQALWTHPDGLLLRLHHDQWFLWNGCIYLPISDTELDARLFDEIKEEFDFKSIQAQARKQTKSIVARPVTNALLSNVRLALRSKTLVPSSFGAPCWLGEQGEWPAHELIVCPNGLFHLPTLANGKDEKLPLSPRLFSTFALDYEIRLDAPKPAKWLSFLEDIWEEDTQAVATLQEWMGYCLTHDTRQQKILMMIGPPRSGKGTIADIMIALVGAKNVACPQLGSFRGEFALQPLLGKTLAIVNDARLKGPTDIVVERLLSISGKDSITVNRKNKDAMTVKLPARLVIISNELPRLDDASGALVSRMIFLRLTKSFLGKEDHQLGDKLLLELPGILPWAIQGWKRLTERGKFVQPESGKQALNDLDELSSPIKPFLNERCVIGNLVDEISRDDLYAAYDLWCQEKCIKFPYSRETFGRNLRAILPSLGDTHRAINGVRVRFYVGIRLK